MSERGKTTSEVVYANMDIYFEIDIQQIVNIIVRVVWKYEKETYRNFCADKAVKYGPQTDFYCIWTAAGTAGREHDSDYAAISSAEDGSALHRLRFKAGIQD